MRNLVVAALLGPGLAALTVSCSAPPAPAGRLLLNNFNFESTTVQAVLTAGPDCAIADPAAASQFVLPSNGTGIIPAPPGFDICWRREPVAGETMTTWSRAYTGSGRVVDAAVEVPQPNAVVAAAENEPVPVQSPSRRLFPK